MGQPIGSLEEALLDSHAPEETVALLRLAAEKGEFCAVTPNGDQIRFGGVVAGMLAEMVESLATGQQAYLGSASAVLSPEDAAQVIGVSRPYVYRLMDRGTFPHIQQDAGSTRRKLLLSEVLEYQAGRLRRIAAADDLAERSRASRRTRKCRSRRWRGLRPEAGIVGAEGGTRTSSCESGPKQRRGVGGRTRRGGRRFLTNS